MRLAVLPGAYAVCRLEEHALAPVPPDGAEFWSLTHARGERSLASFRGGPVFPALFIGAAGGIVMSHLPGLPLVAGVAMGMGAMLVVMLTLPLTSVLLPAVLLPSSALTLTPLVIVAVVVAYVTAARLTPGEGTRPAVPAQATAPADEAAARRATVDPQS